MSAWSTLCQTGQHRLCTSFAGSELQDACPVSHLLVRVSVILDPTSDRLAPLPPELSSEQPQLETAGMTGKIPKSPVLNLSEKAR